jgi:hypothetical protein
MAAGTPSSCRLAALVLGSALALQLLGACAPKYYSGNSQNVPLLNGKGAASAGAAINPDGNRADARGALAVTDRMALQANAALYFPRDEDSSGNGGSGGLFELGAGYYAPLPQSLLFETWLLAAYGGLENHFPGTVDENPGTNGKLNANLVRLSLQPGIGYKHRYFEAALSSRLAMLNYFNVGGDLVTGGENQQQYLRDNRLQFLVEPALTFRAGGPSLKAEAQLGWSVNLTESDFPQDKNWASAGIVYFFDPLE